MPRRYGPPECVIHHTSSPQGLTTPHDTHHAHKDTVIMSIGSQAHNIWNASHQQNDTFHTYLFVMMENRDYKVL